MDNAGYVGLTRMRGLEDEMRAVANNIANVNTTGYRSEHLVFAEVLAAADNADGALAMAQPRAHVTSHAPGGFTATGNDLDLALQGPGYFQVRTPEGDRLTRAGSFMRDREGMVVSPEGWQLLDAGGAPIQLPPEARNLAIGEDGVVSADGQQIAQIGMVEVDPIDLIRERGALFRFDGVAQPAFATRMSQGFLEMSNVSAVSEMTRMIEVQRAYELGQSFLDKEDGRLREAIRTMGRSS